MKKMNNKGFSLVELIVVVLIMAIIAVALAPQVMKWVENSRKSTDIENYNALLEAANVASTSEDVISKVSATATTITMNATNTVIAGPAATEVTTSISQTLPGYASTKITSGDWKALSFVINITKSTNGIQVSKGAGGPNANNGYPQKDFS